MRVVGGRLGGRMLAAPSSRTVRPTSERLRESIFDILEHRHPGLIEGARVVDLFAGSGALAIEALSRGARFALFVDNGAEARALLRANVEALGLGGVTRIWRADATRLGKAPAGGPFALAFLDPPYERGLAGPALVSLVEGGWLAHDALIIVEEAVKAEIAAPVALRLVDERTYGDTRLAFFERAGEAHPETAQQGPRLRRTGMGRNIARRSALWAAFALAGCAEAPDIDPIAQQTMIGLSQRDILACMGAPASRRWVAEGTEIWTYPIGETTTHTPPWAFGLNFSAIGPPEPCDVRIVMTKARVSQVGYVMAEGGMLPSGRQCTFAVYSCARRRELL